MKCRLDTTSAQRLKCLLSGRYPRATEPRKWIRPPRRVAVEGRTSKVKATARPADESVGGREDLVRGEEGPLTMNREQPWQVEHPRRRAISSAFPATYIIDTGTSQAGLIMIFVHKMPPISWQRIRL
ncbi:hypothetical protein CEXT_179011 [Caerostris extrusa]|uniref:Uncharacterized protein n=1 Tax=Caerostris extrusa TaxID=172846 RepID=A0AAV4RYU9_CAEEX|nr:hypothetical protein CEXT_179011 [Caerostris extrusa]